MEGKMKKRGKLRGTSMESAFQVKVKISNKIDFESSQTDFEVLQAQDESNSQWVDGWKKAIKKKH